MAALSFKGRFVDLILEGKKNQTIRNFRKYPITPDAQPPFYTCSATGECFDGHGMNHLDPEDPMNAGKWKGFRWLDPMEAVFTCVETKSRHCTWLKMGKHNTGHKLDGKTHQEFPHATTQ